MNKIWKYALLNALGTVLYIGAVVSFMNFANASKIEKTHSLFAPIVFLMLLVLSASVTGSLIFGRPVLWYMEGKKKQAVSLLISTLGIFLVILIIILSFLFSLR